MSSSGAYYGVAYNFTYAIPQGADPTAFYVGTFAAGEVKVSKRTGSGAISTANIASSPTAGSTGLMNITLSATEMQADEVTVEFIPVSNDFAARAVSIVTSNLPTPGDVIEIAQDADAATRLSLSAGQIIPGTVDTVTNTHTPTTTEFQADDITEATGDHYNGRIVIFTSGNLISQATEIIDYQAVGGIGQFTVTAMTEAPANNDTFIIV